MPAPAAAWPSSGRWLRAGRPTEQVERGGWLLRDTPGLYRGRSNAALSLRPDPAHALYERHGLRRTHGYHYRREPPS